MTAAHQERARRALEQIAYGEDPSIPVGARTVALGELSRMPLSLEAADALTPDQVLEEVESLAAALPGMLALARVGSGEDPSHVIEPPTEEADLREVVELQQAVIDLLEVRLADRERALQNASVHRRLPAASQPLA